MMKRLGKLLIYLFLAGSVVACTKADEALPNLEGTSWLIIDVAGVPVIESSQASMRFSDEGSVIGFTGCNRFTGTADIQEAAISFSPMKATRRGCSRPLLSQEKSVFNALSNARSFALETRHTLLLLDEEGLSVMSLGAVVPEKEPE